MAQAQHLDEAPVFGEPKSIALVDVSYLFALCWHGQARDAQPGDCAQATLDRVAAVRESVEHCIVCLDSPPYNRRELLETYKAHREKPSDAEVSQKRWVLDRLEKDGYNIARAKGYEADDVIATLANAYSAWCDDIRIVSSDKDVAACVTDRVRMYVPAVGDRPAEIRGPAEVRAKFGVAPADMPLWLALVDDSSDGVPGVPGIGPKKAAGIVNDCKSLTGIADALAVGDSDGKPSAMWKSLADHWDQLGNSLKLVTLATDAPVDAVALLEKRDAQPLAVVKDEDDDDVPISPPPRHTPAPPAPVRELKPAEPMVEKQDPSTAIVKSEAAKTDVERYGAVTQDLQPQDLRAVRVMATWIHNSRLYGKFPSVDAVCAIIMRGRELGIGALTALDAMHCVEGKPTASAQLIQSLVMQHPRCEYLVPIESTSAKAVCEIKLKGAPPFRAEYTLEEAKQAGLIRPRSGWEKFPADMCWKMAMVRACRRVLPGAILGMYAVEEMGGDA